MPAAHGVIMVSTVCGLYSLVLLFIKTAFTSTTSGLNNLDLLLSLGAVRSVKILRDDQ